MKTRSREKTSTAGAATNPCAMNWHFVDEISDLILSFRRCRSDRAYEIQYFSQYPTLTRETLLNYDFVDEKKEKKKIYNKYYGLKCVSLVE